MARLRPTPAGDVLRIALAPRALLNAYLVGDVLVDAGMRGQGRGIVRALAGRPVTRHVLTHAHADHAGGSATVVRALGLGPVACATGDLDDLRAGRSPALALPGALRPVDRALGRYAPVEAVELADGATVGPGFVVVATPGHTPGHVSLWRAADRVLIAGDVLMGLAPRSLRGGLRLPPAFDQPDPAAVRSSARRLAELEQRTILFGHGPPMTDAAPRLHALARSLA
jgi:glyoxylase-like metal-dependent hydrolase (beta-lactamase superfamily II)